MARLGGIKAGTYYLRQRTPRDLLARLRGIELPSRPREAAMCTLMGQSKIVRDAVTQRQSEAREALLNNRGQGQAPRQGLDDVLNAFGQR